MDIKTIKELRAKITPGNWETLTDMDHGFVDIISDNDDEVVAQRMKTEDADFIAQAPAMIDFLLSEVERLEGENNSMRYAIGYCSGWCQNALDALESGKNKYLKRKTMFIRRTSQPLEVGMRIRLGGLSARIENLDKDFGDKVYWYNEKRYMSYLPLLDLPDLEIWVDDEPKEEPYRSPLTTVIFKQLAEAVESSVHWVDSVDCDGGSVSVPLVRVDKLITELKKLSEV